MEKIFHLSKIALLVVFSILIPILIFSIKKEKNKLAYENCDLKNQIYNLKSEKERMLNEIKTMGLNRQTIIDSLKYSTILEQDKVTANKDFGSATLSTNFISKVITNGDTVKTETSELYELTPDENKKFYAFLIMNKIKRTK